MAKRKEITIQQRLTNKETKLTKPYSLGSYNKIKDQEQWIRITEGFPDNWTAEGVNENGEVVKISDMQRYKMCGNAVITNVIEAIVRSWIN